MDKKPEIEIRDNNRRFSAVFYYVCISALPLNAKCMCLSRSESEFSLNLSVPCCACSWSCREGRQQGGEALAQVDQRDGGSPSLEIPTVRV